MWKLFGAWDTKFQNNTRKLNFILALSRQEKKKLIFEGVMTVVAMVMIYFGCIFILRKLIYPQPLELASDWNLVEKFGLTPERVEFYRILFTIGMSGVTVWFLRWRLSRRYRYFELNHILQQLDYIAKGHYDYRISTNLGSLRMVHVVSSINQLVDSTVEAMEEERRIEQTKNELIANISHDIRTPLTSVIGYLGLLEEAQNDLPDELKQYVHIAYGKSQQMKRLLDNLFDYIRMQNADEPLNRIVISADNFLNQIAAEYECELAEKGMILVIDVAPKTMMMRVDPEKMVRVYDNLMTNAIKYSQAKTVTLTARKKNHGIELVVKNDGKPISPDALKQLFQRFYREEKSRSSETEGSGLGLAIVERIIWLHEGTVTAESTLQETRFIMTIGD